MRGSGFVPRDGGGGGYRDGERGGGERYERSATFNPRGLNAPRDDAGGPPAAAPAPAERRKLNLAPRGSTKPTDGAAAGGSSLSSLEERMAAQSLGQ